METKCIYNPDQYCSILCPLRAIQTGKMKPPSEQILDIAHQNAEMNLGEIIDFVLSKLCLPQS